MTSTAATAAVGLALLTILAPSARCVEAKRTQGQEIVPADSCGGDYDGTSGNITSPNYPDYYPTGVTCIWTITTTPNTRITVTFEDFQLDYSNFAYLEIRDGNDSSAQGIETCRNSHNSCNDVTTSTNTLYLKFYSDSHSTSRGFKLLWFADSCGGEYEGTKGVITSPLYPRDYPYNSNCTWRITSSPNTRITVTFEAFGTYDSYDYLEIRDGNDSTAELIEQCSESSCDDVISSTNTLHLYFNSNNAGTAKGFKLIWFLDPDCGEDYTGTKGAIVSVRHPNNYPNNIDCVYTLMSPINTRITVNFESFETSNSYDYLQIRDGPDMNAQLLGRCSGSSCESVKSTINTLYIHFHTSNEDQASGFKLNWYSGLDDIFCYYCDNSPDSDNFDPVCAKDNYGGQDGTSDKWNSCYTNFHYDGSHRVERGGTENYEVDGSCYDSGFSITCFCMKDFCNKHICQNCSSTTPPSMSTTPSRTTPTPSNTIQPASITTTNSPTTLTTSPATSSNHPTTSQSPTPAGLLQCYSCISCNTIDEDTQVETSDEFLSCFTAIELGSSHFVIRGGSPDLHVDGSCRPVADGAYECYCNTGRCNSDAMDKILGNI